MQEHDPEFHERLQRLVEAALAAGDDRGEALRRGADGDVRLHDEAVRLLALMDDAEGTFGERELRGQRDQLESALDGAAAPDEEGLGWMPESIGPYTVDHVVGRGGTGIVFAAHQSRPSRAVALKLLHPTLITVESTRRLLKEADALGRLQHPGIAQIFEAGTFDFGAGEQPFIAMELIDGPGLVDYADREELSTRQRAELLARVCDAVEHAHARGVVHRDLKPENVLVLNSSGQPKLLDFGIASLARDSALSVHGVTTDGQMLGTACYMAPEQTNAIRTADWRLADVFSIGAMGFELLTGSKPRQLEGMGLTQVLDEVTQRDIPNVRRLKPSIALDLATIVGKATASEPRARYASVAALGADLRRYLQDRTISARAPGALEQATRFTRRHRALVAGTVATGLALVMGAVLAAIQARAARRAEAQVIEKLYAAEMLVASGSVMEPVTRARTWEVVERWRDAGLPLGWEWHLLASVRRRHVVELDIPEGPFGIAWRPDGEAVAVAMSRHLGLFDPDTGAALSMVDLELPDAIMLGLAWGESGDRVVAGGLGAAAMWEPGIPRHAGEIPPGKVLWRRTLDYISRPIWKPGSDEILCIDSTLKCLDAATGEVLTELPHEGWRANGQRLDPTGEVVFSWDYRGVLTRRLSDWSPVLTAFPVQPEPRGAAWHPDGERIALACIDGTVRVVATGTGEELLLIDDFHEPVYSVDWHPTKEWLLASSEDGTVRVFDTRTGDAKHVLLRHQTVAEEARWSPDGARVASVGIDGEALVWRLDERPALRLWDEPRLAVPGNRIRLDAAAELGSFRVATHEGWCERSLDSDEPAPFHPLSGGARISASGAWRATGGGPEPLTIENMETGERHVLDVGTMPRMRKAWSPDAGADSLLVIGDAKLWRVVPRSSGAPELSELGYGGTGVQDVCWSPDGRRAVLAMASSLVRIYDIIGDTPVKDFQVPGVLRCNRAEWSPDGSQVALACGDGSIRSIDAVTGDVVREWRGHANQVEAVAWHPGGDRIAGASRDRSVKIWDVDAGDLVASFDCAASVADVLWIAGGAVLVAVDVDGRSYAWDARRSLDAGEGW